MSFSCADCEQTFNNSTARSHHRWSQHSEIPPITVDGKQYSVEWKGDRLLCPVEQCGRSYARREAFTKHVKRVHAVVRVSLKSYSSVPVGSSQEDGRREQLSLKKRKVISEASGEEGRGGEGRGEALPPTTSSAASEQPNCSRGTVAVSEKVLATKELAAQLSDMVTETVINKLTAIGLTAENIKKLEHLAAVPPLGAVGGGSQVASLADAVLGQLTAIGLTEENVKKLTTLASSESSQAVWRPLHLDDEEDLAFASSSFTDDPFNSSTWATEKNRQRGSESLSSSRMSTGYHGRLKRLAEGPLLSESSRIAKPSHPPQTKLHPFDTLPRLYDSDTSF